MSISQRLSSNRKIYNDTLYNIGISSTGALMSAVPVPSAWLLVTGILDLIGLKRKRQ